MQNENLIITNESFIAILDSRNATRYNNGSFMSDVLFEFDEPIKVETNTLQWTASVLTFSAPNSIYIINETNCLLSLTNINLNYITNYKFPYGNYNVTSFINQFNSALNGVYFGVGYSININTTTNILTITSLSTDFTINNTSTINSIMGFEKNKTYTSINNVIKLPFTCNFNGMQNLNIHMPSVTTKNFNSLTGSVSNIIQSIPIQCGSNQIYYIKTNDYNFNITTQILDSLNIQIKDDLGNFINFNNQHFNLTLVFNILKNMDRFKNDTTLLHLVKYGSHAGIGAYEA